MMGGRVEAMEDVLAGSYRETVSEGSGQMCLSKYNRLFMRAVPMPVNFYKIRKHRSSSPARRACRRAYHHQGHSGAHQPQPRPWQYHRPRGRVQGGEHEVTLGWSVTKTKAELKKLSLSY